jgi:hypothetical protein
VRKERNAIWHVLVCRQGTGIAMGLFATGVAASVLLIAAHDRPFTGQISIGPEPLLQIMPGESTGR